MITWDVFIFMLQLYFADLFKRFLKYFCNFARITEDSGKLQ